LKQAKLVIGWLYPELLNLYGDRGNIECLVKRCEWRGIKVEVKEISISTRLTDSLINSINFLFMGGGPDTSQKELYEDFTTKKRGSLIEYAEKGGVSLFVCGGYQLLGRYYQPFEGDRLPGISLFDMYTEHFGRDKKRLVGNVVVEFNGGFNQRPRRLVGFENHGGRTYLGKDVNPLGKVLRGFGNNGEDKTEGAVYKNTYGTYLHGPILPKNPHFTDQLIRKALEDIKLKPLDDSLEIMAHSDALKLKR